MYQETYKNNNLIPFQIINNSPKCPNAYQSNKSEIVTQCNGNLPMFEYGLKQERQNYLNTLNNTVGLLSTRPEMSPYYKQIKPDMNYARFLYESQNQNC